jgi:hypothetical protein
MRELREHERKAIAALYSNVGADIPRHLLPDVVDNPWLRYELEKALIPPCDPEEYEKRLMVISPTAREEAGAGWMGKNA